MLAWYLAAAVVFVCLYVRLFDSSRCYAKGSRKQRLRSLVFCAKDIGEINSISQRGRQCRWSRLKSANFDQYLAISQKWCKIGT